VRDAERSLYATQDQLAQSDAALSTNMVALFKALGGRLDGGRVFANGSDATV
jgi:outer membrane protein TolC